MHQYPSGLPRLLREPHGFEPVNNILRTPFQSGHARQRVTFESVPDRMSATWHLNGVQSQLFRSFVKLVGGNWFQMRVSSPEGDILETLRFTSTPTGPRRIGLSGWAYSGELELRERFTLEGDWAEFAPEWVLMSDIFDVAMNDDWPDDEYQTYMHVFDTTMVQEWP